jgi:hypothetical protein
VTHTDLELADLCQRAAALRTGYSCCLQSRQLRCKLAA